MPEAAPSESPLLWTLETHPLDGAVALDFYLTGDGPGRLTVSVIPEGGLGFRFALTRDEARRFARALLAAAGDGRERTFGLGSGG